MEHLSITVRYTIPDFAIFLLVSHYFEAFDAEALNP